MLRSKDSIFTRCNDDIRSCESNGIINAKDIQQKVEMHIAKLDYNAIRLSAQLITAICLNQNGYRAIGKRSGIYLNPELITDFNHLGQIINNANISKKSKSQIIDNLKSIGLNNFPNQMVFDFDGNVKMEKSLEEIIEELKEVI